MSLEKDTDTERWSEKGERGGGYRKHVRRDHAKEKRDMRREEKKRRRGCIREGGRDEEIKGEGEREEKIGEEAERR